MNDKGNLKVISFISGKGGVGKSVLAANVAYCIAQKNKKVLLWDANRSFPNTHIIFGVEPPIRLGDVYRGISPIEKAIFRISDNLHILADEPASLSNGSDDTIDFIDIYGFISKNYDYDFILFDTPAGLNDINLIVSDISDVVFLLITDEPTSLLDGYGLIKVFSKFIDVQKIKLIVNNAIDREDGIDIANKMNLATEKFLNLKLNLAAIFPYSRVVRQSIIKQELFVKTNPTDDISIEVQNFSNILLKKDIQIYKTENELIK